MMLFPTFSETLEFRLKGTFHRSISSEDHITVNPRKHHVSVIIPLDCGESEDAESAYKDSRLREILASYPAFDAAMNDQKSESHAAESPS